MRGFGGRRGKDEMMQLCLYFINLEKMMCTQHLFSFLIVLRGLATPFLLFSQCFLSLIFNLNVSSDDVSSSSD